MFKAKNYVKATTLEEAYELNQKKSNAIAGGMLWLKMSKRNIGTIVDLSGLGLNTIEETTEEFRIGCMCTLRQLEKHEGLNTCFNQGIKEMLRHIVGTQFRNSATVGGSIFGRYGFSDVLTGLLVLDTRVELYHGGIVTMAEFADMPYNRDILVRLIIKKDGRKFHYSAHREAATDFPVITCATAHKEECWYIAIGARSGRGKLVTKEVKEMVDIEAFAKEVVEAFVFTSNMRGSAQYRKHLATIHIKRAVQALVEGGNQYGN